MSRHVQVGVAVVIIRNGHILLGERLGSHGSNTWAVPGGHIEPGESIEECAKREVFEETGLLVNSISKLTFTNDIFEEEKKHYITLFVRATCEKGEPTVKELDKCKCWKWCRLSELPDPLFLPIRHFLDEYPVEQLLSDNFRIKNSL